MCAAGSEGYLSLTVGDAVFSSAAFFRVCRERLGDPSGPAEGAIGDFELNPDFPLTPGLKRAAVLAPIVLRDGVASVLLTRRTDHLSAHAGQIAFPGGRIEPTDASAVAAALREAEEEIGLDPALVSPLGCLPPYRTGTGYEVIPIVGEIRGDPALRPNPDEVAEVFEAPLAFLMDAGNHRLASREIAGRTRRFYEIAYGRHLIWGATAGIIRALYERVYGR